MTANRHRADGKDERSDTLLVSETFCSIQGEGVFSGAPSFFVRLYGCNLSCLWCDTPYASRQRSAPRDPEPERLTVEEILSRSAPCPAVRHFVLTGGEPLLQPAARALCAALRAAGRTVTVETNGTIRPDGIACDLASLSPKLPGSQPGDAQGIKLDVLDEWLRGYACQLKFVVATDADIAAAERAVAELAAPPPPERIFLMPQAVCVDAMRALAPWLIEHCRRTGWRLGWRMQLSVFGNQRGV